MRLVHKIALLLALSVIGTVGITTYLQTQLFVEEQQSSLKDLQSTFAVMSARRLTERMDLLMAQLEPFATPGRFAQVVGKLPGWSHGEIRPTRRRPASSTLWSLEKVGQSESVRWRGFFNTQEVTLDLEPDWFQGVVESSHGAKVSVLDRAGNVLFSAAGPKDESSPSKDWMKRITSQELSVAQTIRYTSLGGKDFLGTFLAFPTDPPFFLSAATPWDSIEAVTQRTYRKAQWISLLLLCAATIMGMVFANSLTRPLRLLSEQTGRIAKGDFTATPSLSTRRQDEVGVLSRAFLDMTGQLARLRDELRQSERLAALGQFSAAIAHEIKNPLASILGNAQIIRRELQHPSGDNEAIATSLGFVESETLRANRTIAELLKFARRDKRPETLIDLTERLRFSVKSFESALSNEGISLVDDLTNQPVLLKAHPDQMQEVFSNLILNAIYAMRASKVKRLRVATRLTERTISLIFEDTGSGIPPEAKPHLFEPFFTTKPFGEGTGLGLAVCHGVVTNHGGTISVDDLSPGTRFTLTFSVA